MGGIDQLAQVIAALKDPAQRSSRRLVVSAWNPGQLDAMVLPPCHLLMQFHVRQGEFLSCAIYQRSGDVGLGVPFNIASYAFLTHMLAKHCGLVADELVYFLGDAHIYEEHIEPLKVQVSRRHMLYPFPQVRFHTQHDRIEDYGVADLEWLQQYQYHPTVSMPFVA
jgi:thymidylate synthase